MTWIVDIKSKRRLSVELTAGLIVSAVFVMGAFVGSAEAQGRRGYDRTRGYHHHWNGGYYRPPPVVYGSPYGSNYYGSPYYPPPVVYGPSIGIRLPGISIGIGR